MEIAWNCIKKSIENEPCRWSTYIGGVRIEIQRSSPSHPDQWVLLAPVFENPIMLGPVSALSFAEVCHSAIIVVGRRIEDAASVFHELYYRHFAGIERRGRNPYVGIYVSGTPPAPATQLGRGMAPPPEALPATAIASPFMPSSKD